LPINTAKEKFIFALGVFACAETKEQKAFTREFIARFKRKRNNLSRCVGILTAERKRSRSVSKPDLHNEISTCKTALAFYRVPRSREFEEKTHYFTIISEIHLPTMLTNKIVFISPGAVSPGEEELKGNWRAE
jgi:heme-degrading monooxygenase HmoA